MSSKRLELVEEFQEKFSKAAPKIRRVSYTPVKFKDGYVVQHTQVRGATVYCDASGCWITTKVNMKPVAYTTAVAMIENFQREDAENREEYGV